MSPFRRLIDPGGVISERLERLRYALETLRQRLHEALAQAVGDSVSGIVRETVQRLLHASAIDAPEAEHEYRRPSRSNWFREEHGWYDDGHEPDPYEEQPEPEPTIARESKNKRLPLALLAGWQAMRWWLKRQGTSTSRWLGIGVGVAAGIAAWVGGPLALASLNLAGSATQMNAVMSALSRLPSS